MQRTKPKLSIDAEVAAGVKAGAGPFLRLLSPGILLLACLGGFGVTFAARSFGLFVYQEIPTLRLVFLLGIIFLAVQAAFAWRIDILRAEILPQAVVSSLLLTGVTAGVELWRAATLAVPITYTEAIIFVSALKPGGLLSTYAMSNLRDAPFLISIYGPLYYSMLHWGFSFAGPSVLVGRWISIAAVAAIMAMFFLLPPRKSRLRIFAPLLFLLVFSNLVWGGSLGKPDYIGAAFSLLAVLTYMALRERLAWYLVLILCILSAAALLIKVSLVAGFAAIAIDLLWSKQYRNAAIYILGVPLLILFVYTCLWSPTHGGIWTMTVSANAVRMSSFWRSINLRGLFTPAGILFLAMAAGASYILFPRTRKEEALPSAYFLIAFGWFLVAIARPGSSSSYFMETAIAGTSVIGRALSGVAPVQTWAGRLACTAVLAVLLSMTLPQILRASRHYTKDNDSQKIATALAAKPTGSGQYVMADVYYVLDVVRSGQQPIINDSAQFTTSADSGRLSAVPMLEAFRSRKVPYAVLFNGPDWHLKQPYGLRYWPSSVLLFVKANYACQSLGSSHIFLNQMRDPLKGDLTVCQLKDLSSR